MIKYFYALIFICFYIPSVVIAQDEPKPSHTEVDEFISKSGGIVKIEDYTMPRMILQLSYGDTRVRKISSENKSKIYYQVSSEDYIGSISAEDFPALLTAFETLKAQVKDDVKPSADILVKQYVDRNGFELGYVVEGKKVTWFVKQFRNCPRTLFIKDPFSLEDSLKQASVKMEVLR